MASMDDPELYQPGDVPNAAVLAQWSMCCMIASKEISPARKCSCAGSGCQVSGGIPGPGDDRGRSAGSGRMIPVCRRFTALIAEDPRLNDGRLLRLGRSLALSRQYHPGRRNTPPRTPKLSGIITRGELDVGNREARDRLERVRQVQVNVVPGGQADHRAVVSRPPQRREAQFHLELIAELLSGRS